MLDTAIRAAQLAGQIILDNFGKISKKDIDQKIASDFVTRVDTESEQIIIKTIKDEFPDHHFLAEESLKEAETDAYRWIIDPLDGTTNYIHQYPFFSLSIALEYKKEIISGVVYDPLREELFTAEKGKGAFLITVEYGFPRNIPSRNVFLPRASLLEAKSLLTYILNSSRVFFKR